MDEACRRAAHLALVELIQDGSPVVTAATIDEIVDVGWRRWSSYDRRRKARRSAAGARVEDLAKGLRDTFESDPRLVGPLMEDYRFLAQTLDHAFTATPG